MGLGSIQSARQLTKDDIWDSETSIETATDDDDVDEPLDQTGASLYQGVAARLNYVALDRPDMAYAITEAARNMSAPREGELRWLRKIGQYLLGQT